MAVLVLGGYGLIGSAVIDRLRAEGVSVIGLGRDTTKAARRRPDVAWRTADLARLQTPETWAPLLIGVEAVVNAAGVLQQGLGDDVGAVQDGAMRALYAAAKTAGVGRIVQISAVGADPLATTEFLRSKGRADAALRTSGAPFAILRPALVISHDAYGGTALLRGLAAIPGFTPLVLAESPVQTVWIGDVAEAVAIALRASATSQSTVDLAERPVRTLRETVQAFRAWRGAPAVPTLAVPGVVGRAVSALADGLGWLGWRSPLRTTALAVMREGVVGDPDSGAAFLGRELRTLPDTLASLLNTAQERAFGRAWLAGPVVIATLSAFWIASGAVGLSRAGAAAEILTRRGAPEALAAFVTLAAGALDIALGLAVLARPFTGAAMKGMIATSLAYLLGASVLAPDLWLDPLGPLIKVVPALVLALVGLALLEQRR
jgi:uncharacterized protein YbjT (DUF2867 family)